MLWACLPRAFQRISIETPFSLHFNHVFAKANKLER
jgi:hypothetical protein